jgi:isoleucyl-tRNA synthetase
MDALKEAGMLLSARRKTISYPHSWRSKKPIIFRNTPQWFISMSSHGLRDKALKAIEDTKFFPPAGQNRLRGMIADRPDWVISRQRAWGVPIAVFVNKETGKILNDSKVNQRIADSFSKKAPMHGLPMARQAASRANYNSQEWNRCVTSRCLVRPAHPCLHHQGPRLHGPPTSTWRAPTSTAAGSSPRCWKAAAPAGSRPLTWC